MKTHVLKGSKQEIADRLVQMSGSIREAIVIEDEPGVSNSTEKGNEDIFLEMKPHMIDVSAVDDSREAVYAQMDGE